MRGPTRTQQNKLLTLFPLPGFVDFPAVGIDISDFSVKFIEILKTREGMRVGRFGDRKVPSGVVISGEIVKREELIKVLSALREDLGLRFVRASLPEEAGFLFETAVPRGIGESDARGVLELKLQENVPLSPAEAVFDYEVIDENQNNKKEQKYIDVVVSVFPKKHIEDYLGIFYDAGLTPLSLEIEAQAIARAVVPEESLDTYMIIDFGKQRTGISIMSGGTIRFTTTVNVGGDALGETLKKRHPNMSQKELDLIKNEKGIRKSREGKEVAEALMDIVSSLKDAINKHYVYWHTHSGEDKKMKPKINKVLLCGGNSNLAGLPEYLSRSLKVDVERANVWTNTFSVDDYIPPIGYRDSLGYAPAIGLALHSDTQRVIPK